MIFYLLGDDSSKIAYKIFIFLDDINIWGEIKKDYSY